MTPHDPPLYVSSRYVLLLQICYHIAHTAPPYIAAGIDTSHIDIYINKSFFRSHPSMFFDTRSSLPSPFLAHFNTWIFQLVWNDILGRAHTTEPMTTRPLLLELGLLFLSNAFCKNGLSAFPMPVVQSSNSLGLIPSALDRQILKAIEWKVANEMNLPSESLFERHEITLLPELGTNHMHQITCNMLTVHRYKVSI